MKTHLRVVCVCLMVIGYLAVAAGIVGGLYSLSVNNGWTPPEIFGSIAGGLVLVGFGALGYVVTQIEENTQR
jgi:hypothetical protein